MMITLSKEKANVFSKFFRILCAICKVSETTESWRYFFLTIFKKKKQKHLVIQKSVRQQDIRKR